MMKRMAFEWNLRRLMAEREMYQTTDMVPRLAEYGVHLSREQVFRLVTQPPQRLSMDTLAALCGILGCTPGDLITVKEVRRQVAKSARSGESTSSGAVPPARRVRVRRPEGL
ncbi:helix-turn-helix transcriptional regulator [Streptomyces sp. ZAF1911]|uniref:helix-turn-helix domain-containing protein n=1 Tax=Streptomyces sp. ZAF1911 TaxID=2944129 RepID=UPI00237A2B0C|nr:helix-turn-helix transcriptional regulator [Streptomyces sp. ZAF1911]MDD9381286.1 helix-turn-helix transcriptional regulator [Streptomyces sp. ZAF1911]